MSVDKNTLIGYCLIAFILTIGHAAFYGIDWEKVPTPPETAYTLITSDFVPGQQGRVERSGMTVYDNRLAGVLNDSAVEQPLAIKDTDCGSYAVSREISYSASPTTIQWSI